MQDQSYKAYYQAPDITGVYNLSNNPYDSLFFWNTQYQTRPDDSTAFTTTNTDTSFLGFQWKITSSWMHFDETLVNTAKTYSIQYTSLEDTSSIDGRYFIYGSSCCISRNNVNTQWSSFTESGAWNATVGANRKAATEALRKVRLLWPHTTQQESLLATLNYPFQENGGIYRVFFRVKQYTKANEVWYNADSGSKLNVFIHNANNIIQATSSGQTPYAGFSGNYPPPQNMATITFDSNTQWIDAFTGYKYAQYEVELVQYGTPAQLVFEASGSDFNGSITLNNTTGNWNTKGPNAFGGCIDDVKICKIGVTTDLFYIKPQTNTGTPSQPESGGESS